MPESLASRLHRTLGRRTSTGRFIPEIDGLRFPAIAIVVIGHLCAFFNEVPSYPRARNGAEATLVLPVAQAGKGVFLFFIVSGFVLALPFARRYCVGGDRVSLKQYFLRRVTRLEPPYLISLTMLLIVKIVGRVGRLTIGTQTPGVLVKDYLASAVYQHNLIYGGPSAISGVAWSLEVEIQFYLLVPVLAMIFRLRSAMVRRAILIGAAVISVELGRRFGAAPNRWSYSIAGNLHYFLIGFLLADVYIVGERMSANVREWDVVALILWPCLFLLKTTTLWGAYLVPMVAALLFVAAFRGPLTNRLLTSPVITTIGGMCYSIYLLHFAIIGILGRIVFVRIPSTGFLAGDFALQAPILLAVALAVSVVYFRYIEQPCMNRHWPTELADRVRRRWWLRNGDPSTADSGGVG